LERKLDKLILLLFCILFSICLVGAIGSGAFISVQYWYLGLTLPSIEEQYDPRNRFLVAILAFFTLVTLYANIIPISLYVSIEVQSLPSYQCVFVFVFCFVFCLPLFGSFCTFLRKCQPCCFFFIVRTEISLFL
jgi:hypothetical protein